MDLHQGNPVSSPVAHLEGGVPVHAHAPGPLKDIPLFSHLSEHDQISLHALMHREEFPAQHCIFWLGDIGDSFYVINKGQVAVMIPSDRGEHNVIKTLDAGAFFGEISLLDGGPRTATIRTTEPTEVFRLGRKDFIQFLNQRPEAAVAILIEMGHRHRASTEALRGVSNPNTIFDATHMSLWQHISDFVARVAASQYFTLFHMAWFGTWISLNILDGFHLLPLWIAFIAFDPFPFGLLTMIVSLEAIFLAIMVMVSQNRQSEKDRLRTDLDYQINVKAQTEIMNIARKLDKLETMISSGKNEESKVV